MVWCPLFRDGCYGCMSAPCQNYAMTDVGRELLHRSKIANALIAWPADKWSNPNAALRQEFERHNYWACVWQLGIPQLRPCEFHDTAWYGTVRAIGTSPGSYPLGSTSGEATRKQFAPTSFSPYFSAKAMASQLRRSSAATPYSGAP